MAKINRRIYESAKKLSGKLLFGYTDKTARLNQKVTKGEIALFLTRNYGISTSDGSGKQAMKILGLSGDAKSAVDAKELTRVIQNWVKKRGYGKYNLQIIQDAVAGRLSGSLTRGEAILLAEKPPSTSKAVTTTSSTSSKKSSSSSSRSSKKPSSSSSSSKKSSSSSSSSSPIIQTGGAKEIKLVN